MAKLASGLAVWKFHCMYMHNIVYAYSSTMFLDGAGCDMVPLDATVNFSIVATLNTCENLTNGQMIK